MGRVPPFLSLDDRIQYLETKGYFLRKVSWLKIALVDMLI